MRVAVLQRVMPAYRLGLFRALASVPGIDLRFFIGDDLPNSKTRSAPDLTGLAVERLPTVWSKVGSTTLPFHRNLSRALESFAPDVILCEGESHLFGMLATLWYRKRHLGCAAVHWSLGGLPGEPLRRQGLRGVIRARLRHAFDRFVVYSSYGREVLLAEAIPLDRIHVATNVGDVAQLVARADSLTLSPTEARAKLGLPERFTALYVGQVDPDKRLDEWILAGSAMTPQSVSLVVVGDGPALPALRETASRSGFDDFYGPGRVAENLPLYFRAADVLVLPGRGGIVISEAMAYSLPVIVHHADGTEWDLVMDGQTGIRLDCGDAKDLRAAMEKLRDAPEHARALGAAGRERVVRHFTQAHMVIEITTALTRAAMERGNR